MSKPSDWIAYGRHTEFAVLTRLLDQLVDGPEALVVTGEAGIGKTTLWRQGIALAERRGHRVLSCRPGELETSLAFASLCDLLDDIPAEALGPLPPEQRRLVERLFLPAEVDAAPPDRLAL